MQQVQKHNSDKAKRVCRSDPRCRGVALVLVLITVGMAAILSFSFLAAQSTSVGVSQNVQRQSVARSIAESVLVMAIYYVRTDLDWRTDQTDGVWQSSQSYNGGTFTLIGEDGEDTDGDGIVEGDGDLADDPEDLLTLMVTGNFNGVTHTVRAVVTPGEVGPPPLALASGSYVTKEEGGDDRFNLGMPSSRPNGDLYIAQMDLEGGTSITSIPSGWTELVDDEQTGNNRLAVYWKIGNSEPASYQWRSADQVKWVGIIHRFRGIDTNNPINAVNEDKADSGRPNAPSVTTTVDGCLILRLYGAEGEEQLSNYNPSGTTKIFQDDSAGNVVAGAAYEMQVSAGSTGNGEFQTNGNKKWVGATVAIKEAPEDPDGGGGPPTYTVRWVENH